VGESLAHGPGSGGSWQGGSGAGAGAGGSWVSSSRAGASGVGGPGRSSGLRSRPSAWAVCGSCSPAAWAAWAGSPDLHPGSPAAFGVW
jgi:hypothetical protein